MDIIEYIKNNLDYDEKKKRVAIHTRKLDLNLSVDKMET